ncbi:hypothetical protein [Celerinatantimonas sp. MCCC 1A17872]|uniref:hypothetical protein n=1 Tax=Celerinatantimonas sp. MCCC 1A17872 TaxID=3177514 RepID=UPI0038C373D2
MSKANTTSSEVKKLSSFSRFFKYSSVQERKAVYARIIDASIKSQQEVMAKAKR